MRQIGVWLLAFAGLFLFYQAPEGIGRWMEQPAVGAGLMLVFFPVAWLVARALGLRPLDAYALTWSRRSATWLVVGMVLAFAAKGVALATGLKLGIYALTGSLTDAGAAPEVAATLAWLALSTLIPSLAEDIVTRGFWARIPRVHWTGLRFVLFTSALYVLNHVYRLLNGPSEWFMLFCFGLAYASAFWRIGSLWAAVGLHWGWNFAGQVLFLAWPNDTIEPETARLLSGIAHLGMLSLVIFLYPWFGVRTSTGESE
jgi:membrane protease YdiL (CAAX protease family)